MHDRTTIPPHPSQSALVDYLIDHFGCKNDAALARRIALPPPVISKLRHGRAAVTASTLLTLHDNTGLSIADLRALVTPADNVPSTWAVPPARTE